MEENLALCIEQALRFLALREHNKSELRLKLKNKGYEPQTIEKTIEFLVEEDSLNEERYTEVFIRSNNRKHPEGKQVVYQRLIQKGTDRDIARKVLDKVYTEEYTEEQMNRAVEILEKKGKSDTIKQELAKRGFPYSIKR